MSKVTIDYSEINSAAKKAKSVSGYYEDFAEDVETKVYNKLAEGDLPGSDSNGNISNARSLINARIKDLKNKKEYYKNLSTKLEKLADDLETHEKNVVTGVRSAATEAFDLSKQSKWAAFSQWAYGTFCVDLANWNPFTRGIANGLKRAGDWVQKHGTKVVNWFKHGDGKYVLGIAMDVLAVAGAIIGTIGAIALCVGTGGAAAPLVVAAIASTIGTVMTVVDKSISVTNKIKALKISRDTGDPGQARFYGNIGKFSDLTKKRDYGGATANAVVEGIGTGYDVVHTVADITAVVAGAYGQAGLSGSVTKDASGRITGRQYTYDPAKAKSNIKTVILDKACISNKNGKWTFDAKKLFSLKPRKTGAAYASDMYAEHLKKLGYSALLGDSVGPGLYKASMLDDGRRLFNGLKTFKKITGFPGKVYKTTSNIDKVLGGDSTIVTRAKSALSLIGGSDFNVSSPVSDFNDTVVPIIETVSDTVNWGMGLDDRLGFRTPPLSSYSTRPIIPSMITATY